ncbi:class I SAM-dependent methyltransferase [Natronincola ferrireducens]|nr:class I SAM-dependent methyltransferase [Natronincola ferrireducens]
MIALLTRELEKVFAQFPATSSILSLYYKNMVGKEIHMGNICKNDKVLCIGGGSFPCTALQIAQRTGAYVEVIDIDPIAIKNARRVVASLHMEKNIKIIEGRGQEIDPSRFSVIHIARQACPHIEILNNILNRASNGARILMRSNKNHLKTIHRFLNEACCNGKCCCMEKDYTFMQETVFFIKSHGGKRNEKVSSVYSDDTTNSSPSLAG